MSLETDLLLDRRRLKRRLNFWRVAAIVLLVAALIVSIAPGGSGSFGPHVARLNVRGVITEDRKMLDQIAGLERDSSVRAVVVAIDSPGGSVAGGASLRLALMRLASKKPVVAVMEGTAASAGYMISLAANRIFASEATLTGSIGVILETGEVSGLLGKLGITADAIVSGPLKDQPSFTKPLSNEGRAYLQGVVNDLFDQFVTMVATARQLDKDRVRELADGRAYTGRQALDLHLIDQIGDEQDARAWLEKDKGVPASLPIRDVQQRSFLQRMAGATMGGIVNLVADSLGAARVQAGGAWAIWPGGEAR